MRIRELQLRNYRAFSNPQPFLFGDRFTVIAGVNGRGKTALLDGLALLLTRLLPMISPARGGYRTINPSEVYWNAEAAELVMKINCVGVPIKYELTYSKKNQKIMTTQLPNALKREVRMIYNDPSRSDDAAPLAVYYSTDRAGYLLPNKLPSKVPKGQSAAYTRALLKRNVDFRDFMARFRVMIELKDEQHRENPCYLGSAAEKSISMALQSFLGGFANLRVQESPLSLLIDKKGVPLDLSQLSDGERSFLAVICDLVRRLTLANPLLPDPLHGAGVVLIDELELHLHPKWQREVVEKLRNTFPNIQFIATTHSPFVIQSLKPGELINLDPEEFTDYSGKSIEDIAENVMGVELPQKSERFQRMMRAAEEYFKLLRQRRPQSEAAIAEAEQRLNELAAPFSDDPAFQALLKIERKTHGGGKGNAPGR